MTTTLIIPLAGGLTALLVLSSLVSSRCRAVERYHRVLREARRIERQRLEILSKRGAIPRG